MIHIQTWSGSGSVAITDMENAGKRGKLCRQVHFQGWQNSGAEDEHKRAAGLAGHVQWLAERMDKSMTVDEAKAQIVAAIAKYGPLPTYAANLTEDTIRGIDAPREVLTAGVEGVWSGGADERGIHLSDLTDHYNDPKIITPSSQSDSRAYELARKVWAQVQKAATFHEASDILSAAGCKLHYYCAVD